MSTSEILAQELCAFAFCWRLERRDGVTLGLSSHDRAFAIGGLDYLPAPGITPSAVRIAGDHEADVAEVSGALSSTAISAADLETGRWDGAAVSLHLTEWTAPGVLWLELARGTLGSVSRKGRTYMAALQGAGGMLRKAVVPETSPTCRAALGDRDCAVDLRPLRTVLSPYAVEGETVRFAGLAEGVYLFGDLRWLTGPCAGLRQTIVAQDGDALTLAEPPPLAVQPGMLALLTQGCDKRLASCAGRFGNAVNFRGEPFLPGIDLITRYPGA